MSDPDTYIRDVASRLGGMDSAVKDDVLKELRAHIDDLVRMNGGNVQAAMMSLEPPAEVAKKYKHLYGYGSTYKAIFIIVAAALAVLTLPVLQIGGEEVTIPVLISLIFLGVLIIFLLYVAVMAGKSAGLMAGLAACVVRLGVFGALILAGGESIVVQGGGAGLLVAVSILLILVGYIPGEAKAKWTKPSGEI